jgi:hypothetical protein
MKLVVAVVCIGGCGENDAMQQPAPAPPMQLTRRDHEPVGAHCERGGTAIHVGLDRDGDGVLEDAEIDLTEYVCDAPAPAPITVPTTVLVRKDRLAPSPECPTGAIAVQTGIDDDSDGVLEDAEIDLTTRLCNSLELWDGNFTGNDWLDPVKVTALRGARVVMGSLSISVGTDVVLPSLELVTGNLTVSSSKSVLLPALRQVGGDARIGGAAAVAPSLAALERVGGTLSVGGLGARSLIDAPRLREIARDFVIGGGGALSMPELATIGGSLALRESIAELHLDKLSAIGGSISAVGTLPSLVLPSLQTIGADVQAFSANALTTIDFPRLRHLGGHFFVQTLPSLTTISMSSMSEAGGAGIGGAVTVFNASALRTFDLGRLESIAGGFTLDGAPVLSTFAMRSMRSIGSFWESLVVRDTALEVLDFPRLQDVGDLSIETNPVLREVKLPNLFLANQLAWRHDPMLETITAPSVSNLLSLALQDTDLRTMDFGHLIATDALQIDQAALSDLSGLHALRNVGDLSLKRMDQLHDLAGLSSLRRVSGVEIASNHALASLAGLERVTHVPASLRVADNPALTSMAGLQNVTDLGGTLDLDGNPALTDAGLPGLRIIFGSLRIVGMASLTDLSGLGALTALGGDLTLQDNPGLSDDEIAAFENQLRRR